MKVYVLSKGEYSDYSVMGVYSSEENAEKYARYLRSGVGSHDDVEISEYELDDKPAMFEYYEENARFFYRFRFRNSELLVEGEVALHDTSDLDVIVRHSGWFGSKLDNMKCYLVDVPQWIADDINKARKIAFDRLAKFRAQEANIV